MPMRTPLGENRILQCLPAAERAEIQSFLTPVSLVLGEVLYYPDDVIATVYFPLSGLISLLSVMASGDQIEHGIVGRSGLVGVTVATNGPRAFGQTVVQIAGEAYQLPRAQFISICEKSALLRRLVHEYDGYLYFQAIQSGACHALHTVEARFCRWMLQSQDVLQSDIVGLTQESLAHMLGVQRKAVSLSAQSLQAAGLIQYSRGAIRIVDREGLKGAACECYQATRNYTDRMSPPLF